MTETPDNASVGVTAERSDAARNRSRLLEAAARLIAGQGAENVTMREVTEAAAVGKGTLFRRFGAATASCSHLALPVRHVRLRASGGPLK